MESGTAPTILPEAELLSPQERLFRKRAGFGVRYRALMIDMTLSMVGGLGFALLFNRPFKSYFQNKLGASGDAEMVRMSGGLTEFYGLVLALTVGILFFMVAIACVEGAWGTSPGKRFLKIKIRNESGKPADKSSLILRAVVKNLGVLLSVFAIPMQSTLFAVLSTIASVAVGLGYLMALDRRRQTLHDRIAETAVYTVQSFSGALENLMTEGRLSALLDQKEKPASGGGDGLVGKL